MLGNAGSWKQHTTDFKLWFGGGIAENVAKDLNSSIIDTVPWFSGEKAGGKLHREHWGHTIEWYYAENPSRETIKTIKKWKGGNITDSEAFKIYKKHLPKGGGRELLIKRLRKSYPRLSRKNAGILTDAVFANHLEGDLKTPEKIPAVNKRIKDLLYKLKRPPSEMIEVFLKIEVMEVKGENIAERALKFVNTPKNQEYMATATLSKIDKNVSVNNIQDRKFIGFSKNEKDYIFCRGNKGRVETILKRYNKYTVMVQDDLFTKLKQDPKYTEKIRQGHIVSESHVLSTKTIQACSKENLQKKSEIMLASGEGIYVSNKLKALYQRLPKDVRISVKAGAVASLFSALGNTWAVIQGEKEIDNAAMESLGTGLHAGTSLYITNALIQKIGGGKYALTAIVDASAKELMPGITTSMAATSAFLNYGVATFIFDQTKSVYFFAKGNMNIKKFIRTTGKNVLTSSGAGVASMCSVALGCNPAGFTVMAVVIGGYLVVNQTLCYVEKLEKRNYLFIEDVLGHLPLEMQRRVTPWDRGDRITPWDRDDNITPWDQPSKQTPWNRPQNVTPWD